MIGNCAKICAGFSVKRRSFKKLIQHLKDVNHGLRKMGTTWHLELLIFDILLATIISIKSQSNSK